ncbi:nucleoside hydrolase [Phytohabitans rumicis]|uniref:nucleoside hydrolase n=1 Tax=Phytohabitans rumicis TaxID=1076125 RepID=UPI0031E87BC6
MRHKILLDTDIGSDIDDAVCLAYLLAQPRCELLGVTTVTGEATRRAMMASALCRAAGVDVPIHPGAEATVAGDLSPQARAPQAERLAGWDHETRFPEGGAVEFLRRTIRAHPGEVTLLAIGPLTNVALLFARDPSLPALLKALVLMGGRYATAGKPEWNIRCDPLAARAVYGVPVRRHRSVGLDVTTQVAMDPAEFRRRCAGVPLLRPVLDFAEVWFAEKERLYFHDPLAAVTLFADDVCGFEAGAVTVDAATGTTAWRPAPGGPHEVATRVSPDRFFDEFFGVF